MAKFLTTSATSYFLEELIKNATERVVLISPYLKLNDRVKELLEDKDRLKIDVRIVYGKVDLRKEEINWLQNLTYVRTSFCKNLHAKCYLNEEMCIITSLNLYEFSQVNNNEMGILLARDQDGDTYSDAYDEAQRIIRISDERELPNRTTPDKSVVRDSFSKKTEPAKVYPATVNAEKVNTAKVTSEPEVKVTRKPANTAHATTKKATTTVIATNNNVKNRVLLDKFIEMGYLKKEDGKDILTDAGIQIGGELKIGKHREYFLWPEGISIDVKEKQTEKPSNKQEQKQETQHETTQEEKQEEKEKASSSRGFAFWKNRGANKKTV